MVSGALFFISFQDAEAEGRFKNWVLRGNEKSKNKIFGSMGLTARVLLVREREYLFLWEHNAFLSLSWLLRLLFKISARKLRKRYVLRRVRKLDLADLVLSRGFGHGTE